MRSEDLAVTKYLCCYCCTVQTTEITGEEHPGKPQLSDWNSSLSILLYVANTYQNFSAGMAKNISAAEKESFFALLGKINILDSICSK